MEQKSVLIMTKVEIELILSERENLSKDVRKFKNVIIFFTCRIVGRESCLIQQIGLQIVNKNKVFNW